MLISQCHFDGPAEADGLPEAHGPLKPMGPLKSMGPGVILPLAPPPSRGPEWL